MEVLNPAELCFVYMITQNTLVQIQGWFVTDR